MTGYQPPFDFMKSLGIKFQSDEFHTPVYDETSMESSVENLYLAGVVCGGLKTNKWFIENSRVHAELIINSIKQKALR
ncbi:MAG: NAD(P)-binding domain-containing protein [Cyclobacteriaceae bacterium]